MNLLKSTIVAGTASLLMVGAQASAQQAGSHNPAVKDSAPHAVTAPAKGANSFTKDQAMGRFAKAGYTGVTGLTKTNGVWQATATKDGKQATVMLDYKGNVTAQ